MYLSTCLLALFPGAAFVHHPAALAPTADGKLLFVVMSTGVKDAPGWVCVWDLAKPELRAVVPEIPAGVTAIQPTADGKRFVLVAGSEWGVSRVEVWDTAGKKRRHDFEVSRADVGQVAVSPDGKWVAYRTRKGVKQQPTVSVWNTDTGERVAKVEKSVADVPGTVAFATDSKHLVVVSPAGYAEFDLATGEKGRNWARKEPARWGAFDHDFGTRVAVLPDGRGAAAVSATGKRRQSYVVRLLTEKKDWFLGEFWDEASAPVLPPDGRLLVVTGGRLRADGGGTFVLKLDADGGPELTDKPGKGQPYPAGREKEFAAWRGWGVEEPTRGDREPPKAMAFSADGRRLFVTGRLGTVFAHDADRRTLTATLFSARVEKDELPAWYILTPAGEVVGSAGEVEALVKGGKVRDATKVKAALGME